jgi:hypothetical protein
MLIADPRYTESSTESCEPTCVTPYTLSEDPSREKLRNEHELPKLIQSSAERLEPNRLRPYIESDEPNRASFRRLRLDPKCT